MWLALVWRFDAWIHLSHISLTHVYSPIEYELTDFDLKNQQSFGRKFTFLPSLYCTFYFCCSFFRRKLISIRSFSLGSPLLGYDQFLQLVLSWVIYEMTLVTENVLIFGDVGRFRVRVFVESSFSTSQRFIQFSGECSQSANRNRKERDMSKFSPIKWHY